MHLVEQTFDGYSFAIAFKGVFLEGLEVIFIVLTFGAQQHRLAISAVAASLTAVVVATVGVLVHRPLSRVPENTLKFIVGILLTSFGLFWSAEGAGVAWPGGESAIPVLIALIGRHQRSLQPMRCGSSINDSSPRRFPRDLSASILDTFGTTSWSAMTGVVAAAWSRPWLPPGWSPTMVGTGTGCCRRSVVGLLAMSLRRQPGTGECARRVTPWHRAGQRPVGQVPGSSAGSFPHPFAAKVPEVIFVFWVVKILTTAGGEATSDYLKKLGNIQGGGTEVRAVPHRTRAAIRTRRYRAFAYWFLAYAIAIFGTGVSDFLHLDVHIPYAGTTLLWAVILAAIFLAVEWKRRTRCRSTASRRNDGKPSTGRPCSRPSHLGRRSGTSRRLRSNWATWPQASSSVWSSCCRPWRGGGSA